LIPTRNRARSLFADEDLMANDKRFLKVFFLKNFTSSECKFQPSRDGLHFQTRFEQCRTGCCAYVSQFSEVLKTIDTGIYIKTRNSNLTNERAWKNKILTKVQWLDQEQKIHHDLSSLKSWRAKIYSFYKTKKSIDMTSVYNNTERSSFRITKKKEEKLSIGRKRWSTCIWIVRAG